MSPGQIHPIYQRNPATRSGYDARQEGLWASDAFLRASLGSRELALRFASESLVLSIGELTTALSHLERALEHASSRPHQAMVMRYYLRVNEALDLLREHKAELGTTPMRSKGKGDRYA